MIGQAKTTICIISNIIQSSNLHQCLEAITLNLKLGGGEGPLDLVQPQSQLHKMTLKSPKRANKMVCLLVYFGNY